jgi:hypothetical protein
MARPLSKEGWSLVCTLYMVSPGVCPPHTLGVCVHVPWESQVCPAPSMFFWNHISVFRRSLTPHPVMRPSHPLRDVVVVWW